jgi:hypothetical protein
MTNVIDNLLLERTGLPSDATVISSVSLLSFLNPFFAVLRWDLVGLAIFFNDDLGFTGILTDKT